MGYRSQVLLAAEGPAEVLDGVLGQWRAAWPDVDPDDLPGRREDGGTVTLAWYSPSVKWYSAGIGLPPGMRLGPGTALEDLFDRLQEAGWDHHDLHAVLARVGEETDDSSEQYVNDGWELGGVQRSVEPRPDLVELAGAATDPLLDSAPAPEAATDRTGPETPGR